MRYSASVKCRKCKASYRIEVKEEECLVMKFMTQISKMETRILPTDGFQCVECKNTVVPYLAIQVEEGMPNPILRVISFEKEE